MNTLQCLLSVLLVSSTLANATVPDNGSWYATVSGVNKSAGFKTVLGDLIYTDTLSLNDQGYAVDLTSGETWSVKPAIVSSSEIPDTVDASWVAFEGKNGLATTVALKFSNSPWLVNAVDVPATLDINEVYAITPETCVIQSSQGAYAVNAAMGQAFEWKLPEGGNLFGVATVNDFQFVPLIIPGTKNVELLVGLFESLENPSTLYSIQGDSTLVVESIITFNGKAVVLGSNFSPAFVLASIDFSSLTVDAVQVTSIDTSIVPQGAVCNGALYVYSGNNIYHFDENLSLIETLTVSFTDLTPSVMFSCSPDNSRLVLGLYVSVNGQDYNQILMLDPKNLEQASNSFSGLKVAKSSLFTAEKLSLSLEKSDYKIDVSETKAEESFNISQMEFTKVGTVSVLDLDEEEESAKFLGNIA